MGAKRHRFLGPQAFSQAEDPIKATRKSGHSIYAFVLMDSARIHETETELERD